MSIDGLSDLLAARLQTRLETTAIVLHDLTNLVHNARNSSVMISHAAEEPALNRHRLIELSGDLEDSLIRALRMLDALRTLDHAPPDVGIASHTVDETLRVVSEATQTLGAIGRVNLTTELRGTERRTTAINLNVLRQCLLNLLLNAFAHGGRRRGETRVRVIERATEICISISNEASKASAANVVDIVDHRNSPQSGFGLTVTQRMADTSGMVLSVRTRPLNDHDVEVSLDLSIPLGSQDEADSPGR